MGEESVKHADQCTPAMCVCGLGIEDGTPMRRDYIAAGQWERITRLDWTIPFDFDAVLRQVKLRMGWDETKPYPIPEYWRR